MSVQLTPEQEALLRRLLAEDLPMPEDKSAASILRYLNQQGLSRNTLDEGRYIVCRITEAGKAFLAAQDKEREDRAKADAKDAEQKIERIQERKQDRRDKWLISILSACCGSILTLCAEHFDKIAIFLRQLFH